MIPVEKSKGHGGHGIPCDHDCIRELDQGVIMDHGKDRPKRNQKQRVGMAMNKIWIG